MPRRKVPSEQQREGLGLKRDHANGAADQTHRRLEHEAAAPAEPLHEE